MKQQQIQNKHKYFIMASYAVLEIMVGFILDTPEEIITGLYRIIVEPDLLITDYIGVGGMGAAFVNSGFITLFVVILLYYYKLPMSGLAIVSIWLVAGFGFFGKNIVNMSLIICGVMIYARYQQEKFSKYIFIALLSSSLGPLATYLIFNIDQPIWFRLGFGIFIGLLTGFLIPPLATYLLRVHQGFNLYNIGFVSGVLGTIFISIFKSYGLQIEERFVWSTGNNRFLGIYLLSLFSITIILGYLLNGRSFKGIGRIYSYAGRLVSDFTILEGFAPTLINMGINGIVATLYVLLVGGDLNGAILAGVFTIVGFAAFGKHLLNILPIFLGVIIGGLTKNWQLNDPVIVIAGLFATTLAPIAGEFGWKYGVLAGFIHSSVVLNVGYLHGGFNLYNNGLAGGLVAATLIPIIEAFRKDD